MRKWERIRVPEVRMKWREIARLLENKNVPLEAVKKHGTNMENKINSEEV